MIFCVLSWFNRWTQIKRQIYCCSLFFKNCLLAKGKWFDVYENEYSPYQMHKKILRKKHQATDRKEKQKKIYIHLTIYFFISSFVEINNNSSYLSNVTIKFKCLGLEWIIFFECPMHVIWLICKSLFTNIIFCIYNFG